MIKSMSLRRLLTRQSSTRNPVLSHSHSIGALWKYETATPTTGRLPGKSFFHAAVRSPTNGQLPSSPGRIFGTLSDKTANAFTTTTTSQQNNFGGLVSPLSGHSQLRMFTTSSAPVSKKKTENEAEGEIASPSETPPKNSFQSMFRQYGKIFVGTYLGVYGATILSLFMSIQSGQLDAMYMISLLTGTASPADPGGVTNPETIKDAASAMKDLVELLESYTLTRPVAPMVEEYPWTANFAIAWVATKLTEPIRFGVTVVATPPIARLLGHRQQKKEAKKNSATIPPPK